MSFCEAADVSEELPQFGPSFTDSTRPTLALVQSWIAEGAADIRAAVASGGYDPIEEPLEPGSNAERWLRRANIDGALKRLGIYLYSYGQTGAAGIPFQDEFGEKLEQLRRGSIIFGPGNDIAAQNRLL